MILLAKKWLNSKVMDLPEAAKTWFGCNIPLLPFPPGTSSR